MVRVKYYDRYGEDGYRLQDFSNYMKFTQWFIENHKKIVILEIYEL